MKKEKYIVSLLWGIVAYAVAILAYFTLKAFNHSADFISAFGSILSATATMFAAYVAIHLYTDWREQHNKLLENNFIMNIVDLFNATESKSIGILLVFNDIKRRSTDNFCEKSDEQFLTVNDDEIQPLIQELKSLRLDISNIQEAYNRYTIYSSIIKNDEINKLFTTIQEELLALSHLGADCHENITFIYDNTMPALAAFFQSFQDKEINNLIIKLKALN